MFESLSHLALQQYWWVIISLLGAVLVFLLFVQGGQTLIYTLGKNETERSIIVNALGRKWEFTFTTLVTFGGAFFASFPLFYSTSFGGAYWVWMAILFAFIIQAVSYEFRSKPKNLLGPKVYETFLYINGALGTILLGTAVATFFTGSAFEVNKINLTNVAGDNVAISSWQNGLHGLEAAFNFHNVSLGLALFFLARVLASLYFTNNINHSEILTRARRQLLFDAVPFLGFFLFFIIKLLLIDGYAVNPETKEVYMEQGKYLNNLLEMPFVLIMFVLGVLMVILGIYRIYFCFEKCHRKGIYASGIGTVLVVMSLFFIAGFNNTSFYPSNYDLQSSLTIENASSSHFTLTSMSYVSLLVPFVLFYIIIAWRAMNKKPIDAKEIEEEKENGHIY
ncbi:MAG: cytochrome d ubiquinol oxidase subunit II [Marinilabiliales bacterium]